MSFKITNGTPNLSATSLCLTCSHGQNVTGRRLNDSFTLCRVGGVDAIRMPQPVVTCTEYDDKREPPLWQMEKIAWRFSVDDRRKTAGFITPTDWKRQVKDGKQVDDD